MKYFVYILFSERLGKYYVGHTEDLERRLVEHNSGKGNYTSKGIPWKSIHIISMQTRSEAIKLEHQIKKRGIKRYLEDNKLIGDA
jgi:putative endonuclease